MADYIVTSGELTSVANAIREKNGTNSSLSWPNEFVSGISSGGGGETWNTVFEGSVTTHDDDGEIFGIIENLTLNGNSIRVTFNGAVYELPKTEHGYGAENDSGIDFSTYPLFIATGGGLDSCTLWTQTAGTYSLKIEEPQSGGSSDFRTAQVTVVVDNPETFTGEAGIYLASSFSTTDDTLYITADEGIYVENNKAKILMCGNAILKGLIAMDDNHDYTGDIISATGNISKNGSGTLARWVVTGDGTITVHFSAIMPNS